MSKIMFIRISVVGRITKVSRKMSRSAYKLLVRISELQSEGGGK